MTPLFHSEGELEKVRLPALTSAAALKGPGPGGSTDQSKSGTTTPPSATTSWSVESRFPGETEHTHTHTHTLACTYKHIVSEPLLQVRPMLGS